MDHPLPDRKSPCDSDYFQSTQGDSAHLRLPADPAGASGETWASGTDGPAPPVQAAEPGPCHLCRRCIEVCEVGAIVFMEGKARILISKCVGCARCVQVCPLTARGIRSSLYTPLS